MSLVSEGTLHCIARDPSSTSGQRLLEQLQAGDSVLLLGKAVTLAGTSHPAAPEWIATGASLHALAEDLLAYAVQDAHPAVTSIDYAGWVALSESLRTQTLWR
ncbi:sulfurtransferase complex subunit TusB [Congregibacter sp.]|uniref:sulfurtransferase complex subunit TusB n=1 Tax=Congregibacter sp. TaxID=2744308 RepID=UPI003F6B75A9